jgi:hypothetical protein
LKTPSSAPQRDSASSSPRTDRHGPRASRWVRRISLTALIALVALATSAANLLFEFRPDLRRDPGIENSAEIKILRMDPNVEYRAYLKRPGALRNRGRIAQKEVGNVIYLEMRMHGFKGRSARLRWFTYHENGYRLPAPYSTTAHSYKAKAPSNKSVTQEWVPMPFDEGRYWVRFELYDSDDILLAFVDSKPFDVEEFPM